MGQFEIFLRSKLGLDNEVPIILPEIIIEGYAAHFTLLTQGRIFKDVEAAA